MSTIKGELCFWSFWSHTLLWFYRIVVVEPPAAEEKKEEVKEVAAAKQETAPEPAKPQDAPVSANAFASGSNINGAQVMTGRSTSRVLAPPGGKTSIKLW